MYKRQAYDKYQEGGIGAEWNSGELVQILVTDGDMNLDARTKDQMKVKANNTIVPGIKIGSPITLASLDTLTVYDVSGPTVITADENIAATACSSDYASAGTDKSYVSCYEKYSERAIITTSTDPAAAFDDGDELRFRYGDGTNQYASVGDFADLVSGANGTSAYTYINYDFRSLNGGKDDVNYFINFTIGDNEVLSGNTAANGVNQAVQAQGGADCTDFNSDDTINTAMGKAGLIGSVLINSTCNK